MRSLPIRGAVSLLALATLAACGDATAPLPAPSGPALASIGRFGRAAGDVIVDHMAPDSLSADITVTSTGGWFRLGNHGIFFPAGAICDPATSTYGPEHWDEPCDVTGEPVAIHAEVRTHDGRSWVDFTPALRFAPSADSTQWVQIYLYSDGALDPDNLPEMTILWSSGIGDPGVDESVDDATQRTFVDVDQGIAFRRIKHFSGYSVSSGIRSTVSELTSALGL